MNNLMIPFLMLMLSQQKGTTRKPVKGASGRTWYVADSRAGASNTPVRDVFAAATGNELVITFATLAGGINARIFISPSTLSQVALADFNVSELKAGKL